jgi:hypothetical protein
MPIFQTFAVAQIWMILLTDLSNHPAESGPPLSATTEFTTKIRADGDVEQQIILGSTSPSISSFPATGMMTTEDKWSQLVN